MPYSEIEIRKLDRISDAVGESITSRIEELNSNARLNYTLRRSFEEKRKYTEEKILELQKLIGQYEGDLADFVQTAVAEEFFYYDGFYNDRRTAFIRNLVSPNIYEEDIEDIILDENAELYGFEDFIQHSTRDYTHIFNFIEGLAQASHFNSFLHLQKEEQKEGNEEGNIYEKHLPRKNKSLVFEGKPLNLSERIKIANKVLNFEGQIRKLNISDTEKYQLMAYILGNDVSNVRNVINGTRPNKIREKEINSYLRDLIE